MIPSLSPSIKSFPEWLVERLQSTINTATAQMSSGYRISQPSDAPDQISPLLQLQASLSHNQAVSSNLTTVQADVTSADQAVSTAIQLLDQALSLGAQGASSTSTSGDADNSGAASIVDSGADGFACQHASGRAVRLQRGSGQFSALCIAVDPTGSGRAGRDSLVDSSPEIRRSSIFRPTSGLSTITIQGQTGDTAAESDRRAEHPAARPGNYSQPRRHGTPAIHLFQRVFGERPGDRACQSGSSCPRHLKRPTIRD